MHEPALPLLPEQARFLERDLRTPNQWNSSAFYAVPPELTSEALDSAFTRVVARHDAFRTIIRDRHLETLPMDERFRVEVRDVRGLGDDGRRAFLAADAQEVQRSFVLDTGPLVRCIHYLHERSPRVLLIASHFLVDEYGWKIVEDETEAELRGRPVPPPSVSYRDAVRWHADCANSRTTIDDATIWQKIVADSERVPVDNPHGKNDLSTTDMFIGRLPGDATRRLLGGVGAMAGISINAVSAVAVINAVRPKPRGTTTLTVNFIGSGRRGVPGMPDLSRCIGDFTSCYPVTLTVDTSASLPEQVRTVQHQLGHVPSDGITYGLLRYLGPEALAAELRPIGDVTVNYVGRNAPQRRSILLPTDEPVGDEVPESGPRDNIHEVDFWSDRGELEINWYVCTDLFRRETVTEYVGRALDILSDRSRNG